LGLGTRARIIAAFAALAAAFAAAFGLQLVRLDRMERDILELRDHQEEMHLALELEDAVRSEYARQARVLAGEEHAPPRNSAYSDQPTVWRDIATQYRKLDRFERSEFLKSGGIPKLQFTERIGRVGFASRGDDCLSIWNERGATDFQTVVGKHP
jgi:hypothetical protein